MTMIEVQQTVGPPAVSAQRIDCQNPPAAGHSTSDGAAAAVVCLRVGIIVTPTTDDELLDHRTWMYHVQKVPSAPELFLHFEHGRLVRVEFAHLSMEWE